LRVIGARGLVTRSEKGSWDIAPSVGAVFRHTDLGAEVLDALSRFSVWTAMYDRTAAVTDHSWNR
jgi:hypothetical protein